MIEQLVRLLNVCFTTSMVTVDWTSASSLVKVISVRGLFLGLCVI